MTTPDMRDAGKQRCFHIHGVPWSYVETGSGQTVVFLHGTLASIHMFEPVVDKLKAWFRCVSLDWPGHGGSGFDPDGWEASDLVTGLADFVEALGPKPVVLVGLSQGGAIAQRLAIVRPDLVAALVILSAGPDGPSPEAVQKMAELGHTLAHGNDRERQAAVAVFQNMAHAKGWVEAHPDAACRERTLMLAHDRSAMPWVMAIPGTYGSVELDLPRIQCPTLVIWGDQDPRAFWGPRMAALIPDAQLEIIQGAGHHLTWDAPQECIRLIQNFVASALGPLSVQR